MPVLGWKSYVGIASETAFGTETQPTDYFEFNSESLKLTIDEIIIPAINNSRSYKKRVQVGRSVAGTIEFPVTPEDGVGMLLKHGIAGTVTSSALSAPAYSHVFTSDDTSTVAMGMTLQINRGGDTGSTWAYTGCKVSAIRFNAAVNQPLMCSVDFVGQNESAAATVSTASFTTLAPFIYTQGEFSIGDTSSSLSTSTVISFDFEINNNPITDDSVRQMGTSTVGQIPLAKRDITGNVQIQMVAGAGAAASHTNYDRFVNGTRAYMRLVFDNGSNIATSTVADTYSLQFDFPAIYYNGDMANVAGAEVLTHTFPFRAIYDSTAGFDIQATLKNAVASY